MRGTKRDGNSTRQIHLRVPEDMHRKLKVMAAMDDQTINEMLTKMLVGILMDILETRGIPGAEYNGRKSVPVARSQSTRSITQAKAKGDR